MSPGDKVLVKGDSGTGKSTLIRAIAGLWPWGSGEILMPVGARVSFIPQQPYFPIGTLRSAILFPRTEADISDDVIREKLTMCGLEHLNGRLDETDQWGSLLSGGEQQRLAFARVLVQPPEILIMDEPTASLDELSQFKLMEYMRDQLGDTMVLHAGHRPGLEHFHNRANSTRPHDERRTCHHRRAQGDHWRAPGPTIEVEELLESTYELKNGLEIGSPALDTIMPSIVDASSDARIGGSATSVARAGVYAIRS